MRRRLPPSISGKPEPHYLSERLSTRIVYDMLASLARHTNQDTPHGQTIRWPIVEVFGVRYALSGDPFYGTLYPLTAAEKLGSVPVLGLSDGKFYRMEKWVRSGDALGTVEDLRFVMPWEAPERPRRRREVES